ncbi:MAG: N-succinyl-L,L-diaminopimelate desuccinylase, partial [uncultured Craurococcus sp.]
GQPASPRRRPRRHRQPLRGLEPCHRRTDRGGAGRVRAGAARLRRCGGGGEAGAGRASRPAGRPCPLRPYGHCAGDRLDGGSLGAAGRGRGAARARQRRHEGGRRGLHPRRAIGAGGCAGDAAPHHGRGDDQGGRPGGGGERARALARPPGDRRRGADGARAGAGAPLLGQHHRPRPWGAGALVGGGGAERQLGDDPLPRRDAVDPSPAAGGSGLVGRGLRSALHRLQPGDRQPRHGGERDGAAGHLPHQVPRQPEPGPGADPRRDPRGGGAGRGGARHRGRRAAAGARRGPSAGAAGGAAGRPARAHGSLRHGCLGAPGPRPLRGARAGCHRHGAYAAGMRGARRPGGRGAALHPSPLRGVNTL